MSNAFRRGTGPALLLLTLPPETSPYNKKNRGRSFNKAVLAVSPPWRKNPFLPLLLMTGPGNPLGICNDDGVKRESLRLSFQSRSSRSPCSRIYGYG